MAKDEYRKFRFCIFCGVEMSGKNSPVQRTREHIFGHKIAQVHPVTKHWSAPTDAFDQKPMEGNSPITTLTSHSVCKSCNNGWLGTDMDNALPTLFSLIKGERVCIDPKSVHAIYRYMARIGIIVDAETSDLDISLVDVEKDNYADKFGTLRNLSPVISADARKAFINSTGCPLIRVFCGFHSGLFGCNPEFNVVGFPHGLRETCSKRVLFVIGKLAALIDIGHGEIYPSCWKEMQPAGSADVQWPSPSVVDYDDFLAQYGQDVGTLLKRAFLKKRRTRRILESKFKKSGRWRWDLMTRDMLNN